MRVTITATEHQVKELKTGHDFWKFEDLFNKEFLAKLSALGISPQFLMPDSYGRLQWLQ
jgi:hypothetical protein